MAFDLTIKIGGEGGEGVISAGDFLTESAARAGYYVVNFKSFPAEIKGGYAQSIVGCLIRSYTLLAMDLISFAVSTVKLMNSIKGI